MKSWSYPKFGQKEDNWPLDEKGERVKPAFLQHVSGTQVDIDLATHMLSSFGIPVFYQYPNDGEFGKLIFGFAGPGADIFVPETMLEDARNILSADIQEEDAE